jgi:hypothetical protein
MLAEDQENHVAKLNGGYFLIHHLCDDEAKVPLLLDIKHAPPQLVSFADEVSRRAKKNLDALDQFQASDPAIRFDQNPLPAIERDTRESIKADKQHDLLFGTKDTEFVRAFLVAQLEASTYAKHLNKVLSEQETSPKRSHVLQRQSAEWSTVREHARNLLRDY